VRARVDDAVSRGENLSRHVVENSDLIVGIGFQSAVQMIERALDRLLITADLRETIIVVNAFDGWQPTSIPAGMNALSKSTILEVENQRVFLS
jgi:hypothetical protein